MEQSTEMETLEQTKARLKAWLTSTNTAGQFVLVEMQEACANDVVADFAVIAFFTGHTPVAALEAFVEAYVSYGCPTLMFMLCEGTIPGSIYLGFDELDEVGIAYKHLIEA
jgi:hypothetical protein